ncbi:unnamed protein product [Ambrosiozyma monospora]|uniref:Unnamed protein product n=1 Tax=Ambrosiozyma monospora TaxID=43982 RepID=A0A9W6YSF3_AMBMO|nr:unnamed protein product [Ambrosiozyma monospora]
MQNLIRSFNQSTTYIGRRNVLLSIQQQRTVVFARGERVRGLIRDPEDILTVNGHRYGVTPENLKPIKTYLESANVPPLDDSLLLQVITHKSFAHGSQPYNARLAVFGEELIQLKASKYALSQETKNQFAVGGKNFDCLGSYGHRMLFTDLVLSSFAQTKGFADIFFCRVSAPITFKNPAEFKPKKMYSTLTTSLVGAIASQHGKKVAEEFIEREVLPTVLTTVKSIASSKSTKGSEEKK